MSPTNGIRFSNRTEYDLRAHLLSKGDKNRNKKRLRKWGRVKAVYPSHGMGGNLCGRLRKALEYTMIREHFTST